MGVRTCCVVRLGLVCLVDFWVVNLETWMDHG